MSGTGNNISAAVKNHPAALTPGDVNTGHATNYALQRIAIGAMCFDPSQKSRRRNVLSNSPVNPHTIKYADPGCENEHQWRTLTEKGGLHSFFYPMQNLEQELAYEASGLVPFDLRGERTYKSFVPQGMDLAYGHTSRNTRGSEGFRFSEAKNMNRTLAGEAAVPNLGPEVIYPKNTVRRHSDYKTADVVYGQGNVNRRSYGGKGPVPYSPEDTTGGSRLYF